MNARSINAELHMDGGTRGAHPMNAAFTSARAASARAASATAVNARPPLAATMVAITALICYGILTIWVPERWALALYQTGIFAIAAVWAVWMAVRPFPLRWSTTLLLAGGPVLLGLAQLLAGQTAYRWATSNSVLNWSANWVLFCVAFQFADDSAIRRRFLKAILYFGFILSIVSTVQMFTSGGKIFWYFSSGFTDPVLGPFVYRNQYAAFIEMILPLALYLAIKNPRQAFRYWLMVSIMVASVVAGASRAGSALVVAEVFVIMFLAWLGGIDRRTMAWGAARFVALALVFTAVVGWDYLWQRFQQADPYVVRRELLLSSIQMVRARPWTGFGMGTWSTVYPAYALFDDGLFANQAHNDWAQWAVEGGIPLAAMMLLFAGLLIRPAWRSLWGLGLIFVLIHCCVDYPMQQRPALTGCFFALAGVLAGLETARRRNAVDSP